MNGYSGSHVGDQLTHTLCASRCFMICRNIICSSNLPVVLMIKKQVDNYACFQSAGTDPELIDCWKMKHK